MSKGRAKKTASRPRARKKTAKRKVEPVEPVKPEASATPPRPRLMMLDDNDVIDSAAALAVAKKLPSPPRPGLMMLEGDDFPPPPKLVRQRNGEAIETAESPQETKKKRRSRATRRKKPEGERKSAKKRKTKNTVKE